METNKIILDLCGGTGSWSKPYVNAGYKVINVTLPKFDVKTFEPPSNVYGILAAPPCTMFSLARTRAKTPRDLKQGMEIVIACLNIIWKCRYKNKLKFWVIENPMGYLKDFLGKPSFVFHPYEFGDAYTKKTCLWGNFQEPKKKPVSLTKDDIHRSKINNRKLPSISDFTGSKQAARRAITPPRFAQAFYEANK